MWYADIQLVPIVWGLEGPHDCLWLQGHEMGALNRSLCGYGEDF